MSLTPNFGFNIPDSTDIVNLLTQCYPNFTIADGALQSIKEQGISLATESKVGTVHNIVRVDSDCAVFWFTATSNFTTGDTFTVDGSPVTAVKVSGAGLETGDFVINSNVPCIVKGAVLTVLAGGGSSTIVAQDVTYDNTGSGLTATDVQDAIDELKADMPVVPATYDADDVTYDNTGSGLTATNVQDAIDEIIASYASPVMRYASLALNQASTFSFNGKSSFSYDSATVNNVTYSMELRDITSNTQIYRWLSNESVGSIALDNTHTYKIQPNGTPANCSVTFTNLVII